MKAENYKWLPQFFIAYSVLSQYVYNVCSNNNETTLSFNWSIIICIYPFPKIFRKLPWMTCLLRWLLLIKMILSIWFHNFFNIIIFPSIMAPCQSLHLYNTQIANVKLLIHRIVKDFRYYNFSILKIPS